LLWHFSTFCSCVHPHRDEIAASPFEYDARQRARRRPLQHFPGFDREIALVTRTFQPVFVARIINGARKMRAFLAVGNIGLFVGPD